MTTTLPYTAGQALARYGNILERIGLPQPWCTWGKRGTGQSVGTTNDCCYGFTYLTGDTRGARSELRNGSIRSYRADRKHPEPVFQPASSTRNCTVAQLRGKIQPGDGVCFRWNPAAGGTPDHIGIFVRWDGDQLVTRECNTGPRPGVSIPCGAHERHRTADQVQGIIRLPYAKPAAKPKPAPAKSAPSVSRPHVVVATGDTLSTIGARHGVTWQKLAQINGLKAPYTIYPKQVIYLKA